MDTLSRLTFLISEFLLRQSHLSSETALVLSNKSSSLHTDTKHQKAIASKEAFYPSPAVFVYTLPNIGLGEVAIRHNIQSENAFFVFEKFNARFLHSYCEVLLQEKKVKQVLCGWTEVNQDVCEGFVYLLSEKGNIPHTIQNLEKFYAQI